MPRVTLIERWDPGECRGVSPTAAQDQALLELIVDDPVPPPGADEAVQQALPLLVTHWQQQRQVADAAGRLGAPGAEARVRLIDALLRAKERQELVRGAVTG